ncbi:hypothetical protein PIN31115_03386 [Pandoraea iniqua]|uniref:Uncharacterized protein n=1 Tax=Pandoraea iniqua TaxID=2508288 RepID=A0A5E4WM73_9BURK|nr:hypothetical protein PIN31115_03386 [Pandoraea iniqua]
MQQDRRHQKRRADRKTQRDAARGNGRRVVVMTPRDVSKNALQRLAYAARANHIVPAEPPVNRPAAGRMALAVLPAPAPPAIPALSALPVPCKPAAAEPRDVSSPSRLAGLRRTRAYRARMRGAALLEVMFMSAVLLAGAGGFANWQAVDGMPQQASVIADGAQQRGELS